MERAAALGVDRRDGKHFAVSELHAPCNGGGHIGCTIKRRDEGPMRDTEDEAISDMTAVHRTLGWEPEHDA
jgi:hypothetical protein